MCFCVVDAGFISLFRSFMGRGNRTCFYMRTSTEGSSVGDKKDLEVFSGVPRALLSFGPFGPFWRGTIVAIVAYCNLAPK